MKLTKAEKWLINFTLNHYDVLSINVGGTDEEILNKGLELLSYHRGFIYTREMLNKNFRG